MKREKERQAYVWRERERRVNDVNPSVRELD